MDPRTSRRIKLFSFPIAHIVLIMTVLGIGWLGYVLWQLSTLYTDLPLPPERVAAQQLRVNETQRQAVLQTMTSYTTVTSATPISLPTFK